MGVEVAASSAFRARTSRCPSYRAASTSPDEEGQGDDLQPQDLGSVAHLKRLGWLVRIARQGEILLTGGSRLRALGSGLRFLVPCRRLEHEGCGRRGVPGEAVLLTGEERGEHHRCGKS